MLGSSADSLELLRKEVATAVSDGDGTGIGRSLFAAADITRQQGALRRALTDPSTELASRSKLAASIFDPHLDPAASRIVQRAAGSRWTSSNDLPQALEEVGVAAVVMGADRAGDGDRVEDELFAFSKLVTDDHDLRDALSDSSRTAADRRGLVRGLLEGKATEATVALAEESVTGGHQMVLRSLSEYTRLAAAARGRLSALVRVAHPLRREHEDRLAQLLEKEYGKPVHINTLVEPDLVGGIRVEIANDVFDGSIASRIDGARQRLVG